MSRYLSMNPSHDRNNFQPSSRNPRRPQHRPEQAEDFIPMPIPHNHRHPFFDDFNHEGYHQHHHAQNHHQLHHHQQPPPHHPYLRPDPNLYHGRVPDAAQEGSLAVLIREFMEVQKNTNREIQSKLEFIRYDLDEKFGTLSTQIENLESKYVEIDTELRRQAEDIKINTTAIHDSSLTTKEVDGLLDEKIAGLDKTLESTTENLNKIAFMAHQTKKKVAEVSLKERQCYSAILALTEGQKQAKEAIQDVRSSLEKRNHEFIDQTTSLGDKSDDLFKEIKALTGRLTYMEEAIIDCNDLDIKMEDHSYELHLEDDQEGEVNPDTSPSEARSYKGAPTSPQA